jgi:two-component system response regulator AtoC
MKQGAYDYLLKPFKIRDLRAIIRRGLEFQSLRIKVTETIETEKGKYYYDRIVTASKKMAEIVETIKKVAGLEKTTVLIQGESGVGKGLLARAIHYNSSRADQLFVEINCAAIPDTLLESELFGYEPGAFTDARRRKIGLIEKADRGTVFLDEIGDMPLTLQAKILKVLEDQSFTRLGATTPTKIDVRFITATNKDLQKSIAQQTFREDLFYRLNVVPILIPPLRERIEDIIPLAISFIQDFNQELHRNYRGISQSAAQSLIHYPWPGNVRELKNIIERIMALHPAEDIIIDFLPAEISSSNRTTAINSVPEYADRRFVTLDELENSYIQEVLRFTGGNKTQAAKILGIHPTSLFRKLKKK